ncbi:MAG: CTP synthase, partial [Bacteroidota bacterium]
VSIHLTLVPYLSAAGELKTKPTQHSVKQLLEAGIQPDILVCRAEKPLPSDIRKKLALFCNVPMSSVIEAKDADSIYDVPLLMRKEKLDERVLSKMKIAHKKEPAIDHWKDFLGKLKNPTDEVKIGLVGKYVELKDAYKSIAEAFTHAGAHNECKVILKWIHSEKVDEDANLEKTLGELHGILVAPGFGERGIEGKIKAVKFARENRIPFFGICLGMQCASIEFARNVLGLSNAYSKEIKSDTPEPVIDLMEDQKNITAMGGTMRLGAYDCQLTKGSKAYAAYGQGKVSERHRHRYEFNNKYLEDFEKNGMIASGKNPDTNLVEVIELKDHPWFVGTQFHPELKSTVLNPHPLFKRFVKAAAKYKREKTAE